MKYSRYRLSTEHIFLSVICCMGMLRGTAQISHAAAADLTGFKALKGAQVGICILDLTSGKYIYQYQGDKYFTPASNTKIFTLFTALHILGDSTTGIRYQSSGDTLYFQGTGDPSLLHPDYPDQPVFDFLKHAKNKVLVYSRPVNENQVYGPGWSWDDYNEDYQPERSSLPIYGNVIRFSVANHGLIDLPDYFQQTDSIAEDDSLTTHSFRIQRARFENRFFYHISEDQDTNITEVPFITYGGSSAAAMLQDTLTRQVIIDPLPVTWSVAGRISNVPVDSLYSHMMYRSDNFFAEQTLMMCSLLKFDTISSGEMIHFMLDSMLAGLPDKPVWVDGSGLSRYNLFTPADLVNVLQRLISAYPRDRLFHIFPAGGEGTLDNRFLSMAGYIHAKTGSLNNNAALSGFLVTRKGRTLVFSVLVGNYTIPGFVVRKQVEKFIETVWKLE
ncbi:MAG TPA: D-alanyl-D-alanine carboxypeptidase [Chitinophagaceae bacterium]|nr:D-alanyl-D-alanine carboxypeptidase [Chitinophagaceae bacterium]